MKSKIKNVIEGGMADGTHTKRFLSFANCVYGFDPLSPCFDSVIDPTLIGKQVQVHSAALWKSSEEIPFFRNQPLHCSKVLDSGNNMRVSALSIDDFVRENQIDVDFIKLDVEGSELNVLVGARATLQCQRPQLAVAIYHTNKDLFEVPLFLKQTLDDYMYRIGHYTSDYTETILYAIPHEILPKDRLELS